MDLSGRELTKLRARAHELDDAIQMGKAGLTDAFLDELGAFLKRDKLVKVRLLPSAKAGNDRKQLGRELAERTQAALVEVKGNTVVLYRKRSPR